MPDIGEGIAEVELAQWHVKVGDVVAEEQILADVMTDKANVEIPSNVAGKVLELNGKPGDIIPVGTAIIKLEVEGKGNVKETAATVAAAAAVPVTPAKKDDVTAGTKSPSPVVGGRTKSPSPLGEGRGEGHLKAVPPPPPTPAPSLRVVEPSKARPASASPDRPLAAPAVRRRAREL